MNKIIIGLCLAMIAACSGGGDGVKRASISGYDYRPLVETGGEKPNAGDFVYFQMDIYDDHDSLLQTYRNQKLLPSVRILEATSDMRKKNPVVDVLSYMSVGDSVALIVPRDSVPNMPQGYEDLKYIEYHLTTAEILTSDEQKERLAAEKELQDARAASLRLQIPEVTRLTEKTLADYKAGKLDLQETPEGVKYLIHERGNGDLPTADRMVTMLYYGRTVETGKMFDNSYERGQGYSFRLGRREVIGGWDVVTPYLPVGTKASVFIPSELGYGERGSGPDIPPNSELYFYMVVDEMLY